MAGCNVEKAYTFKDVYTLVYPMVTYLGLYAHCDPVLLIKLIRIGKTYMKMVFAISLFLLAPQVAFEVNIRCSNDFLSYMKILAYRLMNNESKNRMHCICIKPKCTNV